MTSMQNGFKSMFRRSAFSFLVILVCLIGVAGKPTPAQAGCCNLGGVISAVNSLKAKMTTEFKNLKKFLKEDLILGKTTDFKWQIPGDKKDDSISGAKNDSLIDYFETVFWPRMIGLEQGKAQVEDQKDLVKANISSRNAEGKQYNQFQQRLDKDRVDTAASSLGLEDALCPQPSRIRSTLALQAMADIAATKAQISNAAKIEGSAPGYKEGPLERYKSIVNKRKSQGTCDPAGNNGANASFCTSSSNKGFDLSPGKLFRPVTLNDSSTSVENASIFAEAYIDLVFPNMAFTPMRTDMLNANRPEVMEVMAKRAAYGAQINTFREPFEQDKAARKPQSNVESLASLKKVVERVGFPDDLKKRLYPNGKISAAGIDEIYYKIANLDPQLFITDYARAAALNQASRDAYHFAKFVDMVVLLYDIREQQKTTNKLLGALGSVLTEGKFEKIQALTQSVASNR